MTHGIDVLPSPDVIIIGGGPAGITAAAWCAEVGISSLLLERSRELGGQLLWTHNPIANYPGIRARDGRELRDLFLENLDHTRVPVRPDTSIANVDVAACEVELSDGSTLCARHLIIATGVRRRSLDVPGEAEFHGRGILTSGSLARSQMHGKRIVIVGGGDAALENALILSAVAQEVVVVHRRDEFSARDQFVAEASTRSNVRFMTNARLTAIRGDSTIRSAEVISATGNVISIDCDAVLTRIGVEPNSDIVAGKLDLDDSRYIRVDAEGRTSHPVVYAIGDVANPVAPTICTAVGTAATAVKSIYTRLH